MTRRYWKIDGGLQLLVEVNAGDKTAYHMLNRKAKWQDGTEDAIDYIFSGEPGALEIDADEAAALAVTLGSSLDEIPALPA